MNTFAYPLPIGYQNIINSLIKHMLKDVVSGLSRRKQGFDSPWGYLFSIGYSTVKLMVVKKGVKHRIPLRLSSMLLA